MRYRPFGRTGLKVSAVGFGCWPMAGDRYGAIEDGEAIKAIHRALDRGVNCVDTAPAYGAGHSEEVVARGQQVDPPSRRRMQAFRGSRFPRRRGLRPAEGRGRCPAACRQGPTAGQARSTPEMRVPALVFRRSSCRPLPAARERARQALSSEWFAF